MKAIASPVIACHHHGPQCTSRTGAVNGRLIPPLPPPSAMAFLLQDDDCLSAGEGITKTTQAGTRLWHFEALMERAKPLRGTIRALTKRQAEVFAKNRHPNAVAITVYGRNHRG
jgi:hypothetical protein